MPNVKNAYVRIAIFDADGVAAIQDRANPEIIRTVADLRSRGIKCYLATNYDKTQVEYLREKLNFKQVFNAIFSAADLGCQKPDPQFFERLLKRIDPKRQIPRAEILFWDDGAANVEAAKEFGMQAYQYTDEDAFVIRMAQTPIMAPRFLRPKK